MPFMGVNVAEKIERMREEDPEFKKAWDESRNEYRLIGERIAHAKKKRDMDSVLQYN